MEERALEIGIKSRRDFFQEARTALEQVAKGDMPEKPLEGLFFENLTTLLKYLTPKRMELLEELHKIGHITTHALSRQLGRHYKNVHDDVKILESLGLVEKDEDGRIFTPYDKILAELRLAA